MKRRAGPAALSVAMAVAGACAQPDAPPGGEPDRMPPRVIEVSPEHMSTVDGRRDAVVFRFNERLSEQGIEDAVLVSPETGPVRVDRAGWGSELRVRLDGGWRSGQVYRVVVQPGVRDLFSNAIEEPIELVFSTGPEIPRTAIAGTVVDRLSGRPAGNARVEAIATADSVVHVASADDEGIFVIRHLPAGEYRLRAYTDQNRNRAPDVFEAQDAQRFALAAADTSLFALRLLVPDTTPAVLTRVAREDSMHLRLEFDDAFDPAVALDDVAVRVRRLEDGREVAVDSVMHMHLLRERLRSARSAAPDSLAADSTAVDTTDVDTAAVPPPDTTGDPLDLPEPDPDAAAADSAASPAAQAEPLPAREIGVILAEPLAPETEYVVEVSGAVNISGLAAGGGEASFVTPAPPPETEPEPTDTTNVGAAP